jgi:hypothetical protein
MCQALQEARRAAAFVLLLSFRHPKYVGCCHTDTGSQSDDETSNGEPFYKNPEIIHDFASSVTSLRADIRN